MQAICTMTETGKYWHEIVSHVIDQVNPLKRFRNEIYTVIDLTLFVSGLYKNRQSMV